MPERSSAPSARPARSERQGDVPPADVVEFIRYCHRKRRVGWPDLYDEMCLVAARREFNGWGHDQLAERGVTFALTEMPRLAAWVRQVLAAAPAAHDRATLVSAPQPAAG